MKIFSLIIRRKEAKINMSRKRHIKIFNKTHKDYDVNKKFYGGDTHEV
jgi:hypothetical protein